ncbi:MAG: efflux transporter outer membrane subunit [Syntrophorhabdales bacterium]
MKTKVFACLVLLLASGCMVGPDYHAPKPSMPSSWVGVGEKDQPSNATGQSADLALWWQQLKDPTLNSLIDEALKANLSLAAAEASLRQARAVRGVAAGGLWPSATATASYQRQSGAPYDTGGGPRNLYQAGVDAAWELDFFGGVRRNVESASANVQAAVENLRDVQVSLVAEVALDYVQLRGYQQEIVTAVNNLKQQQHTADITRRLYKVGFNSGLDVANAESTVATTEAQIPVFETGARQSIYALSVLLGRHPGDLLEQLSPTGDLPAIPGEIPAGLPSDLLRRRPDIRQTEAQLHSATAQIGVATAQLFPQFSLTGGVNWQSTYFPTWFQSPSRSLFIGPGATWPIFQGGAIVSNIHAQEALRDQAFITYQQAVLMALQDVENALIAFAKEQEHRKSLSDAVAADHRAVDLSLRLYREGQTDFLNVLTAQRTQYTDENALTQSTQNIAGDLIALYKALGGGWDMAPAGE